MPLDHIEDSVTTLYERFQRTRACSLTLASAFSPEDWMLQSMEEASPIKWNLAHTSWFYEAFVLSKYLEEYEPFDPCYNYLFNSYYQQIGAMHPRPERGLLSRPSAQAIIAYRAHVEAAIEKLFENASRKKLQSLLPLIEVGCAHEEQHQELMLTDIKHALSLNPLSPAIFDRNDGARRSAPTPDLEWRFFDGGVVELGADGQGFSFDNEGPRHSAFLAPYWLASRPVTNADYKDFIDAGGYENASLWLADGWAMVQDEGWRAPIYWRRKDGEWREYSLYGEHPIDWDAPVCHLSFYEAAAYAEFTGFRLPTEFEWEHASADVSEETGRFLNCQKPSPPLPASSGAGATTKPLHQMFGDVWEWTASPYVAYPGYRAPDGAIGEYNGKFMSSQMVLRGGSCATPPGHVRRTYRNFFPPSARWQFAGLRLARDP